LPSTCAIATQASPEPTAKSVRTIIGDGMYLQMSVLFLFISGYFSGGKSLKQKSYVKQAIQKLKMATAKGIRN
jgi:fucose 4-O-acetylase-like acetyltransferase